MQHTYLRYEAADSFGLVSSVGAATSTRAPPSDATLALLQIPSNNKKDTTALFTTAGSYCIAWNFQTGLPLLKLGHADDSSSIGTGKALNSSQVQCLDLHYSSDLDNNNNKETATDKNEAATNNKIILATGWIDGAVRVFDISPNDLLNTNTAGTAFSLLQLDTTEQDRPDPLVLNGHAPSPVSAICLEKHHDATSSSRLASGSSDGTVIVWDLVAESGLFRLLGHSGAITQLHFLPQLDKDSTDNRDLLMSSSLDGLIKVWDLVAQCCLQTLANMRGEVWASSFVSLQQQPPEQQLRHRFLAGSTDGQVRVWNIQRENEQHDLDEIEDADDQPNTATNIATTATATTDEGPTTATTKPLSLLKSNKDDVCHDMGILDPPFHIATSSSKPDSAAVHSKEKVVSIRHSPYSRHVAVLQANSKFVHVYSIRSTKDSQRKRLRRIKRRQEKQHKKETRTADDDKIGNKRGILDDDDNDNDDTMMQDNNDDPNHPTTTTASSYDPEQLRASDEFEYCGSIKASHKVKAFVFVPPLPTKASNYKTNSTTTTTTTLVRVACTLSTNTLELYSLQKDKRPNNNNNKTTPVTTPTPPYSEKVSNLTPLHGHPTGVRAIALSSNDEMALTVSKNTCKLWNIAHRSCLLSLQLEKPSLVVATSNNAAPTFQGLCAIFLPGNTHVVVGTKEGHLMILDTASSQVVYFEEKAHDDAIWSLDINHSKLTSVMDHTTNSHGTTLVTGSADKKVKFWKLARQGDGNEDDDSDSDEEDVLFPGAPMVVPTRVLEMTDEVVAVKYSHASFNQEHQRRMVFVSTLDCTIKVFFDDSLKLFLSLYGHKLPALAVDASDDDMLLVSASADKTIKVWGLDFGDTHKTLHGHADSVTDIRFVRGTHNFFSCSKDGTVRYWDGDRFEMVLVLRGHSAEVNCLAVSVHNTGAFCLSGGMDRQVKVWERTKDIVFLEEERERELEQMFDDPSNLRREEGGTADILDRKRDGEEDDDDEMKQDQPQSEAAVKQSVLSVSAGDRLLEALELADQELQNSRGKNKATASVNPMLLGMEPSQYILWVLRSIKSAELEQALLILPLGHTERLLYYLVWLLRAGHGAVELCCRVAVFTIKTHQHQLVLNQSTNAPLLQELRRLIRLRLGEVRDTVGYNIAACRLVGQVAKEHKDAKMLSPMTSSTTDVWAGLGLGSDVAAALEGNAKPSRNKR